MKLMDDDIYVFDTSCCTNKTGEMGFLEPLDIGYGQDVI